ncbi:MAG TPA: hypothetical protein VGB37_13920, partial [Candidatus Lokiarchaeia archaeon]
RLITLPFSAVFYATEQIKNDYIKRGVLEENLYPEENKQKLLDKLKLEGSGVIRLLIQYYINLKNNQNEKIPLSEECLALKNKYVYDNDLMDQFFNEYFEITNDSLNFVKNEQIKAIYFEHFQEFPKYSYYKKLAERYKLNQGVKKLPTENNFYKITRGIFGVKRKNYQEEKQEILTYD